MRVKEHKLAMKEAKELSIPIDKCNYNSTTKNGLKCYFFTSIIMQDEICDAIENAKGNISSRKQVEQMAYNANKVTLSSEKTHNHEQLTYLTMHFQYQNAGIWKEDDGTLSTHQSTVQSASEIESGNRNNAEIKIDDCMPSKGKLSRALLQLMHKENFIIASR